MSLFLVIFVKYFGEVLITLITYSPLLETHFFQSHYLKTYVKLQNGY